ncbi:MAG: CpsB/CapC family capsule biosynthesis tyrosine phosphatase [Bacteroidota bacterium]
MHSHLITGIDDGAKTIEETLGLLKQFKELGYQKVITTPHVYQEYYPNTSDIIKEGHAKVQVALQENEIELEFEAAAEYYLDEHFEELLDSGDLLSFGNNHILIEMSFFAINPKLEEYIFNLNIKGYKPILAHPERYLYLGKKREQFERLKDLGCLLQCNLLSFTGHYGKEVKDQALWMWKNDFVDLLGSDCHHQGHLDILKTGLQKGTYNKILSENYINQEI